MIITPDAEPQNQCFCGIIPGATALANALQLALSHLDE